MTQPEIGATYRETGSTGSSQLEMVVLLYETLLDDLRRAAQAIRKSDIERRTFELQHALRILEQLQGTLNFQEGGEVARILDQLYCLVRGKIIEAQWKVSIDILDEQIRLLEPVRDAWKQASQQFGFSPVPESVATNSSVQCAT